MKRVNNTGSTVNISYCWADHWDAHGDHDYGEHEECFEKVVTVPVGGDFIFDETQDNGTYINNQCNNKGLD